MLRHVVFFKFKPEVAAAGRQDFVAMLRGLPARIPEIVSSEVGEDIMGTPRSYHVALISTFAGRDALEVYAKHPEHQPVLARAKEVCEAIAAVDFVTTDERR
jgi:hypothetical protein